MVNKVTLIGRLGSDPEMRTLENGTPLGRFSIATSESYRDRNGEWQDQTEWHDVVVWRNAAERAQRSLTKGMLVYIEGKLTHRKWQDKDGNNRKTTEVVANYFRQLASPGGQGDGGGTNYQHTPSTSSTEEPAPAKAPTPGNSFDDDGEDLPF